MSPLRPSPQRGRALKESRPKKGCGGGKQPWSHLLRPRLQGRRLLAAVAGAEGAAGGSRLVSALPRLVRPVPPFSPMARGGTGAIAQMPLLYTEPPAPWLRVSQLTAKLSPLATSRRTDPLPLRVMRTRWAGRDYFLLLSPTAVPPDGRRELGTAEPPLLPPGHREYPGSELKGRREGAAALAGIDVRIPPSSLA